MGKKAGIMLKLSYDEADNLASILLSDTSDSIKKRLKYQNEKSKDSNTKTIIVLMKRLEKMQTKIVHRIYGEMNKIR